MAKLGWTFEYLDWYRCVTCGLIFHRSESHDCKWPDTTPDKIKPEPVPSDLEIRATRRVLGL